MAVLSLENIGGQSCVGYCIFICFFVQRFLKIVLVEGADLVFFFRSLHGVGSLPESLGEVLPCFASVHLVERVDEFPVWYVIKGDEA